VEEIRMEDLVFLKYLDLPPTDVNIMQARLHWKDLSAPLRKELVEKYLPFACETMLTLMEKQCNRDWWNVQQLAAQQQQQQISVLSLQSSWNPEALLKKPKTQEELDLEAAEKEIDEFLAKAGEGI